MTKLQLYVVFEYKKTTAQCSKYHRIKAL